MNSEQTADLRIQTIALVKTICADAERYEKALREIDDLIGHAALTGDIWSVLRIVRAALEAK